jgi:hypothetical protein
VGIGEVSTCGADEAVSEDPMRLVCDSSSAVDCAIERGHGGAGFGEPRGQAEAGDFFLRGFIGWTWGKGGGLRWARCGRLVGTEWRGGF